MFRRLYQRSILIIGLLLGLSLFTNVASPFIPNVNASTVYDGAYVTTNNLTIKTDYYSFNCGSSDITATWEDILLNDSTWSSLAYGITDRDVAQASFEIASDQGATAVTKRTWIESDDPHRQRDIVEITWVEDASDANIEFTDIGTGLYGIQVSGNDIWKVAIAMEKAWTPTGSGTCDPKVITAYEDDSSQWISVPLPDDGGSMYRRENLFANNWTMNPPVDYNDYEGAQVRTLDDDIDEDGLDAADEASQYTSNFKKDTDGDGLNDYVESELYPNRAAAFCEDALCATHDYPNPLIQDLYVEVDWVNDGTRDYKPTSGQISTVIDTFEDQDIIAHFDTGQLGGGGQLPALAESLLFKPTVDKIDFFDLKNGTTATTPAIDPQFSPFRENIWHYMITGMNFTRELDENDDPIAGTSGAAYPGNDASIISMEMLEADFPNTTERDKAVSGTILHELGHNLCLTHPGEETRQAYTNQSAECVYEGIDNKSGLPPTNNADAFYNLENYESVMNYRYQLADQDDMGSIDYSDGGHGTGDHNDWTAVFKGINDFVSNVEPSESSSRRGGIELEPVE